MSGVIKFVSALILTVALTGCEKPVPPPPPPTPTPSPSPTPEISPPSVPWLPKKLLPTARLFNGLSLEAKTVSEDSFRPASQERNDLEAYKVEVTIRCRVPRAASTAEDLAKNDPSLPEVFNDFPALVASAKVSGFYEQFYRLKTRQVQHDLSRLDAVLSRHNFFDCETILEFKGPSSGRRAMIFVADMDVNDDGSDGDRNIAIDASSQCFLPQTSYRWPKQTQRQNPCLPIEEKRLASLKDELANGKPGPSRVAELHDAIDLTKRRIVDLQKYSFLVGQTDPFIVLPGFVMRDKANPYSPSIGDFALVICNGKAYPAVVGDAGPSFKIGEASLRISREVNPKSSSLIRPVSDLKVTYIVFPGTADEKLLPPDLTRWQAVCEKLSAEIGGLKVPVFTWPDIVKPWPTPTPAFQASPMPTPASTSPPQDALPQVPPAATPSGQ